MSELHVAIVCADKALRMEAARAFDRAPLDWKVTLHDRPPARADVLVTADASDGDVRFDPDRPDDVLREVADATAPRPLVIGVVGSSGGCGATSVALHLAASLAGPVGYLDASPDEGAAFRMGIHVSTGPEATTDPICLDGGLRYVASRDDLAAGVEDLLDRFASVVLDLPAQRIDEVARLLTSAVLVMTPSVSSARRGATILARHGELPWAVVVNRLGPGGETTRAELARIVGRRIGLHLPCSPGLRDAEDDDRLLTSAWSPWRRGLEKLGRALR